MSRSLGEEFYQAFRSRDLKSMADLYHEDIRFEDPAFGKLQGKEVIKMWEMLFHASDDLKIEFKLINADLNSSHIEWIAYYSFGKKKRKVVNSIQSFMKFEEGKITEHRDVFSLTKWARQAFGFPSGMIAWTSFFRSKLHAQTRARLNKYIDKTS